MTGQAPPELSEAAEFDRLMALENGDQPNPQSTPAAQQQGDAPASAAAPTQGDQGDQAAPAADGGGSGGQTTEQAGATVSSGTSEDDKWLADLPEDVRNHVIAERARYQQQVQEAEDRFKALHGKLAPTQRALSEAQARLAQQTAAPQPTPATVAPVQAPDQTADEFFESPEWKQWAQDYPGDAKVIRLQYESQRRASQQAISALQDRVNQLAQRLDQTAQVASRVVVNDEMAKLAAAHPDWDEINHSDEFWTWFDEFRASQPKSVRAMYYDNARLSEMFNDAEFNIAMLNSYKATRQPAATPAAPAAPAAPTPPESAQPATPAQPAATAVNPRLSMAVAPDVRSGGVVPAAVSLDSLTPAQAFEHVWNTT